MPCIKRTAKLAKRADLRLSPASEDTSDDWHANVFTVDRRFYVIFCEDRSRLTCLTEAVRKADLQDLAQVLRSALIAVLSHEGFSETSIQYVLLTLLGRLRSRQEPGLPNPCLIKPTALNPSYDHLVSK